MASMLDSRSGGLGLNSGQCHCVVFVGKPLYSHRASLHLEVEINHMGTWKLSNNLYTVVIKCWGNMCWTSIQVRGVAAILLVVWAS